MKKIPVLFFSVIVMFAAFVEARSQECVPKPSVYVGSSSWFIESKPVVFKRKKYVKYGLPRVLGVGDVNKVGIYKKAGVFAEPSAPRIPEVIYLPVREGCEFQPYQIDPTPALVKKKVRVKKSK
jgi:hypothetical protein